jgi:hypothetical protein
MDAAGNTCDGMIGTPSSRLAIPYPLWYTTLPFQLTPRLHPGESDRLHFANSRSIRMSVVPGGRPPIRGLDVFQNTAAITIAGVVTETRPVAKVRFTECSVYPCGSQVRSCMRRCGPWADGLDKSVRGIALRISCSHAGAMRRRPFLCARNRLAVVAVCNTTRYR